MTRLLPPAPDPITDEDDVIAQALESASLPALLASLVHLTGQTDLLDGPLRPPRVAGGGPGRGFSAEEKEEVRCRALEALRDYRDRDGTMPPPPSAETIRRLMGFVVGEPVPDAYVPMMQEEMALDGRDARDVSWEDLPSAAREGFRVLIIGAGMSGLLAAIRLQEHGVSYEVIEKNDALGGTWFENTYPGCRVDVPNHFYCYSFEPNADWSEFYSQRPEIHDYFEHCARKYGVRDHIRFGTEVVGARWKEEMGAWEVGLRDRSGGLEVVHYTAIISGVGQLNRPRYPAVDGRESFAGPSFHSARWPEDLDLAGKRVAVVGTGASAFQLAPEVARVADRVHVVQRSPSWMSPNPNYHRKVSAGKKWLLRHVPFYARWYRFLLFWPASDGLMPSLIVDPDWPHPERSVNALNEQMRLGFTQAMEAQLKDAPELLAKVVPTYPPFVKRMLQDDGSWLATLKRPNVELITDELRRIVPTGLEFADGSTREVDVIVYATGFHANRFLWPMEIRGRQGKLLQDVWGEEPRAYLGITVPEFPNFFCLYGPGTNLAHAGSIIFHSECQVRYVLGCLKALRAGGHRSMECRSEVADAFERRHQEAANRTVWVHPGATSWYKNDAGRVTTVSPFRLVDYWRWTREPNPEDFVFR